MATALDSYAPYDSGLGANVTEDLWRTFAKHWRESGVIRSGAAGTSNGSFAPFGDSTGMQVKVPTGECWIQGAWGTSTAQKTLAITAAHPTLGRRDLVVLRNDFVLNRIEVDVLTGTANASPVYPTLTQNSAKWEVQLAKVVVGAAVSTITAGNVTALQTFTDGSARYTVDTGYQTVATSTPSRLDFDTTMFDSSAIDRPSIREFTLLRAGFWIIELNVWFDIGSVGFRESWIARQGDGRRMASLKMNTTTSAEHYHNIVAFDRFAAGTIIEAWVNHNQGGSMTIKGDADTGTSIALYWLGP